MAKSGVAFFLLSVLKMFFVALLLHKQMIDIKLLNLHYFFKSIGHLKWVLDISVKFISLHTNNTTYKYFVSIEISVFLFTSRESCCRIPWPVNVQIVITWIIL